jgi:hypothetical protein
MPTVMSPNEHNVFRGDIAANYYTILVRGKYFRGKIKGTSFSALVPGRESLME